MSFTTPIFVPLARGLDLSKSATLDEKDLTMAVNVDYAVEGEVRGRPGRAAPVQLQVRNPAASSGTLPAYLSSRSLASAGFTPRGLMRLRDAADERPMLGTEGRLFSKDGSLWRDRGHFACMKVDQPHTYYVHPPGSVARQLMAPDFGRYYQSVDDSQIALLNPTTLAFEKFTTLSSTAITNVGGAARSGTTTATVVRNSFNELWLITRANGADSLTETRIATDAAAWDNDGDAASICSDNSATVFFVAYRTTTANVFKVLRVTTAGVVSATYTSSASAFTGLWVSNSSAADNFVAVAVSTATGSFVRILNATTMADTSKDSALGSVDMVGDVIVVGVESSSRIWWAVRVISATNPADQGLHVGSCVSGTASSSQTHKVYRASSLTGMRQYAPLHQPLKYNGRMYLTVAAFVWPDAVSNGIGNWYTLDLSNLWTSSVTPNGPFAQPTLVARGPLDGTWVGGVLGTPLLQPESACLLGSDGWTFPSVDWTTFRLSQFQSPAGQYAVTVLNRITPSGPRAVLAGNATIISGSVPHLVAGDQCYEVGFPGVRPSVTPLVHTHGGNIGPVGSYTVTACWVYTDGAGQLHRSAPAELETVATANTDDYIEVYVENPYFTERPSGDVRLEIYSTEANPTDDDPPQLIATVAPDFSAGYTLYELGKTSNVVSLTSEALYTSNSEFTHITPSADGGIATLGRRVWMASSDAVYASLLLQPGKGPAWNDEGSLQVDLPAGAGRIMALESLDDKLLIFCERGVYLVTDGGPDNVGVGPDLPFPIRLTDLGCAGPRSTCATDRGVVFCSPLDSTDPQRGGPWLIDRSLSLTQRMYLGSQAMAYFQGDDDWVPEVAYSPERQQLYVTVPDADLTGNSGMVVVDFRREKWSTWAVYQSLVGELRHIDVVKGRLWDVCTEPASYSEVPGGGTNDNGDMIIQTGHLFADGRDGFGWARVRSLSVLGPPDTNVPSSTSYQLIMTATWDQTRSDSHTFTINDPTTGETTWPGSRTAPEWRLPTQKCSSMQVKLAASQAARWTALRLDVQPLPARAPAAVRG